jgi:O-glycosyl hydrolase
MSPSQSDAFASVVGSMFAHAHLSTKIECCEAEGWNDAQTYASALESDPSALRRVAIFTSHGYTGAPDSPLLGWSKPVWITEWSTFEPWDAAWNDDTDASGMSWAENIYDAMTKADASAFCYWWGTNMPNVKDDNESLIQINGSTVTPSGRLWAFANFSRFVRPGAVRVATTAPDSDLEVTAFKNANGSIAVVALNTATSGLPVTISLTDLAIHGATTATPYVTDDALDVSRQGPVAIAGGSFTATMPPRSLVTYVVKAP